jgi:hypothetical protein
MRCSSKSWTDDMTTPTPHDPSIWEAISADPAVPLDRGLVRKIVEDQQRPSRQWLYPLVRIVSRVIVAMVSILKRFIPRRWMSLETMDALCLWFLRRFVSPDAVELLIRHFVIETNLLNFLIRNTPAAIEPVSLRPLTLAGLGDHAVVEHDLNVYDVFIALDGAAVSRRDPLDFQQLDVPTLDPERRRRRFVRLDIQTALCFMNIPFSFALSRDEYRRAVHSMRFDDSLLDVLATITGDDDFLRWKAGTLSLRVDSNVDVPQTVYTHALICEFAHARLVTLGAAAR